MMPRAVLLDLDDTILVDNLHAEDCWRNACFGAAEPSTVRSRRPGGGDRPGPRLVLVRSRSSSRGPARSERARVEKSSGSRWSSSAWTIRRSPAASPTSYSAERELRMEPFPGAIDTVRWLRASGSRLALITNGGAAGQRRKIERFGLADLFDLILIEGEVGFGKPDPRVFERALERAGGRALRMRGWWATISSGTSDSRDKWASSRSGSTRAARDFQPSAIPPIASFARCRSCEASL